MDVRNYDTDSSRRYFGKKLKQGVNFKKSEGGYGKMPDFYEHIQAAKYLEVAPWELTDQSAFWKYAAIWCMEIDATPSERIKQRNERALKKAQKSNISRIR